MEIAVPVTVIRIWSPGITAATALDDDKVGTPSLEDRVGTGLSDGNSPAKGSCRSVTLGRGQLRDLGCVSPEGELDQDNQNDHDHRDHKHRLDHQRSRSSRPRCVGRAGPFAAFSSNQVTRI